VHWKQEKDSLLFSHFKTVFVHHLKSPCVTTHIGVKSSISFYFFKNVNYSGLLESIRGTGVQNGYKIAKDTKTMSWKILLRHHLIATVPKFAVIPCRNKLICDFLKGLKAVVCTCTYVCVCWFNHYIAGGLIMWKCPCSCEKYTWLKLNSWKIIYNIYVWRRLICFYLVRKTLGLSYFYTWSCYDL
jgi:hypothetical protein